MILGELACGGLPKRAVTLRLLAALPRVAQAPDSAVLHTIEARGWWSKGIGWVDAHLLTSVLLARAPILTLDSRLARLAATLGLGA